MRDPLLPDDATDWVDDPWDDPRRLARSGTLELDRTSSFPPSIARAVRLGSIVIVAVSLVLGAAGMWYLRQVNPGGAGVTVGFTVVEGDTLESVGDRLAEGGFVSRAGLFRWYVARRGGLELVPGYYQVEPGSHMGDVMAVLATPPAATFTKVTFPEGFTIAQIGRRLQERTLRLDAGRFVEEASAWQDDVLLRPADVTSLEGLLFPDTYQVSGDETETQVIARMLRLMERVARQENLAESRRLVGLDPYEVLIVASMIEREAKLEEERSIIARVIYNRLELGMPLQIDATLYYGAAPGTPFSELKASDTPYNTYLRTGLPPTPIASPGRASIRAALAPASNPASGDPICVGAPRPCRYLYYVLADTKGRHVFAATLAQHEANVAAAIAAGVLP